MPTRGRDEMIHELENAQTLFKVTDNLLTQTVRPVREKYGFTDEKLKMFYKKLCLYRFNMSTA